MLIKGKALTGESESRMREYLTVLEDIVSRGGMKEVVIDGRYWDPGWEKDHDGWFDRNESYFTTFTETSDVTVKNIQKARNALETGNIPRLEEILEGVLDWCESASLDISDMREEMEEQLTIIRIESGRLIYKATEPFVELPKLISAVSDDFLRLLAKNPKLLYNIDPRAFEEIVAEIFFRNGFEVELTKMTRDGGKDIIAISKTMGIRVKYIIECKRYSPRNKVGLAAVQRLLGVKLSAAANKAILATTSTFTRDARVFSSNHIWDLDLKDYTDVVGWVKSAAGTDE